VVNNQLRVSSAAREAGSSVAIVAGERRLTYTELNREVQVLANQISQLCNSESQPVAFVAHATIESLLLCYAILETAHPALPLNPRLLPTDHETLIEQAGAVELSFDSDNLRVTHQASFPNSPPTVLSPAALVATSGSTGRAKLVRLTSQALVVAAEASAERLLWLKNDAWLLSLSLCHIGGLSIVTRCLLARRPVVLGDPRGGPAELVRLVDSCGVTMISLVSTQLHRLLAGDYSLDGSKLRVLLLGGMHADPWLVGAARTRGIPVLTTYGMTETASQVATQQLSDLRSLIGPCHDVGPPLSRVELKLIDNEIVVRGPMLFDGYVGESAMESQTVNSPVDMGPKMRDGWFHTGDWGRLDQRGRLTVIGRSADRIVSSGENVAPAEVERVLEALPAIERACVFGIPDPVRGERVAAALIIREGYTLDPIDFEHEMSRRLASFKLPRALAIVPEFVLTATGKLDRPATAKMASTQLQSLSPSNAPLGSR
jgi:o-succinylbenzoate---CoA ligase